MATLDLDLTYVNPSEEFPLEATYEFPLEKTTVLSKLVATIDGKTIEALVKQKEEAKERYDDAVAAGNAAVLAERESEKSESMSIKLGNLLPQQEARLQIQLIMQLTVLNGSYHFDLPVAFYPDYSKHGVKKTEYHYEFNYEVRIQAKNKITRLSLPQFGEIAEQNEAGTDITIRCNRKSRQINLFYRSKDMMTPQLFYAEDPQTGEVACMASLVPTFEPPAPQENLEVLDDEEPEAVSLS